MPVVKRPIADGGWEEVADDALQERPLDPELRVFARSAADAKAPIMMLLTAIALLRAQHSYLAIAVSRKRLAP